MVLAIAALVGAIFDNISAAAFVAVVGDGLLNHDLPPEYGFQRALIIGHHLLSNHYPWSFEESGAVSGER